MTDKRLEELSGLASNGRTWFAVSDGGGSLRVLEVDPTTCAVRDTRTAAVDPYDVEDLALAPNGAVWLADIGDNNHRRSTIALHVVSPPGASVLYRLSYPDGPHDAEALLLDRGGVPHIVTKEPLGLAGVYRPVGPLQGRVGKTVPLEKVQSVSVKPTDTPGGPLSGTIGSVLITGGSVSPHGNAVALRTYTDAYVYDAPEGDVVAALSRQPVRIPLPHEPQGEAVALEPDDTLLSGSEGKQPVRSVPGAVAASRAGQPSQHRAPAPPVARSPQRDDGKESTISTLLLIGGLAVLLVFGLGKLRRNR